nr:PREDICTED: uncharacterized protein LOC106705050 isoform X2 [Latimeria chalumnae]|eukprot:XP_014349054.1 PREDICTED: uncharacterized protein LOC106705050 isoform X2 [Latimeria chalumnae]
MSRVEPPEQLPIVIASTPQLSVRTHRVLCLSVSSDSSGRYQPLEAQDWRSSLKSQMEQAHSSGAGSSTGSLERASLFCTSGSNTSSLSNLSSPNESLAKAKSSSRFSLFSPPWNSSSESDSNPPSRSGSKKFRNYSWRGVPKAEEGGAMDARQNIPEHFHYWEPVISKITDYIYVGNLHAAYSGRVLCKNNIDSIIDLSNLPGEQNLSLIPCTCSRGARHSWSRLKVDIWDGADHDEDFAAAAATVLRERCFEDINECIDASTEKRKRVLVHCRDGYSLAPACIIQYLMQKQNMRMMAAYEFVRAKYPLNIKECHQNLLVSLERALRPGSIDPETFKQAMSRKMAWT